jgi:hypothetical protein
MEKMMGYKAGDCLSVEKIVMVNESKAIISFIGAFEILVHNWES